MILLTDEEIIEAIEKGYEVVDGVEMRVIYAKAIAKAQLKKVHEWGNEYCVWHPSRLPNGSLHAGKRRCQCYTCWQALLEEVK